MNKKDKEEKIDPGVAGLLKGNPMSAMDQWMTLARVLAIRDILITAGITDIDSFNTNVQRRLEKINKERAGRLSKKRKRYGFGKV